VRAQALTQHVVHDSGRYLRLRVVGAMR
jgi:hypothetical protein